MRPSLRITGAVLTVALYACAPDTPVVMRDAASPPDARVPDPVVPSKLAADRFALGSSFSCYLRDDASVWCWGANNFGQLGNGGVGSSYLAIKVAGLDDAVQVSGASSTACAVRDEGGVVCWGQNGSLQLGGAVGDFRNSPLAVHEVPAAKQVSVGGLHACALTRAGEAWCWGSNRFGRLGHGPIDEELAPAVVEGAPPFAELRASFYHTCGRTEAGEVFCWGRNDQRQVADSTSEVVASPTKVERVANASAIAVGNEHSCAQNTDAVQCWGSNRFGQLALPESTGQRGTPVAITVPGPASGILASQFVACAIGSDKMFYCWGRNLHSNLTIGGENEVRKPVIVRTLEVDDFAGTSGLHTCIRQSDAEVLCWGSNTAGQSGANDDMHPIESPQSVTFSE